MLLPGQFADPDLARFGQDVVVEDYGYGLGRPSGWLIFRYPHGASFPVARDDYVHQLYWSPDGMLSASRGAEVVFVGPDRAFWVERGLAHEVFAGEGQCVLRICLRQVPHVLRGLRAGTVSVEPAAAGQIMAVARPGVGEARGLTAREALLDGLAQRSLAPIDGRRGPAGPAQLVARELARDPADESTLEEWAVYAHVSPKTLQRHFVKEFGVPFTRWRTRLRLHAADVLLPTLSVTRTARRVGYSSTSAFVAAYAREFGVTPGRRNAVPGRSRWTDQPA